MMPQSTFMMVFAAATLAEFMARQRIAVAEKVGQRNDVTWSRWTEAPEYHHGTGTACGAGAGLM